MKITLILSGGMDSTTLLYKALKETDDVEVLSFDYNQRHKKELEYAKKLVKRFNLKHKIIDITSIKQLLEGSSLTDDNMQVPEGHYAEDNMKQTVVPNRNAIMLSIAYAYAISNKSNILYYGAHSGDHFVYPDCRIEFVKAIDLAFYLGNVGFGNVNILAPFSNFTKAEIVKLGLELKTPFEDTWSCYKGNDRPCLKCGTCTERTEAFHLNNIEDPILTESEWKQALDYFHSIKK